MEQAQASDAHLHGNTITGIAKTEGGLASDARLHGGSGKGVVKIEGDSASDAHLQDSIGKGGVKEEEPGCRTTRAAARQAALLQAMHASGGSGAMQLCSLCLCVCLHVASLLLFKVPMLNKWQ